ncbi:hypothetical protein [Coleofasciculus sp. E2-BRE-01]|uniref:hypothetical protein n=1 Tax=Coleofasciculus sp. E2-BRE-01 TaxID=3069524 RepID=UPI0032FBE956
MQDLDHYPISDRLLAQVLSQILALNPVVVGLGLFRDVPVNYGETRRDVPLERLLVDKSETSIVGAGLATKPSHSPITYQQNPP